jgi:hypothetical protein
MYGRDSKRYRLEIWVQPWPRWLVAQVYHWYDMLIYRVPGFKQLERWLQSRHRGSDIYVPLGCQQDLRCYFLTERRREVVAVVWLTEEEYCKIREAVYHDTCDAE